ncbi:MAG TPA: hypothetical protein VNB49_03285 [Candidatus Dormibacteraeota bacterium]|nr:hypothetical protein [Candidatus Dormibacteraeota bacterium]
MDPAKRASQWLTVAAAALLVAATFSPWISFVGPSGPGSVGAVGVVYAGSRSNGPDLIQWSATGPSWPVRSLLLIMAALAIVFSILPRAVHRLVLAVSSLLLLVLAGSLALWGKPPLGIQVYGFHFEPAVGLYAAVLGAIAMVLAGFIAILRHSQRE